MLELFCANLVVFGEAFPPMFNGQTNASQSGLRTVFTGIGDRGEPGAYLEKTKSVRPGKVVREQSCG